MTNKGFLTPINKQGVNRGDIGPLAKSTFEDTNKMFESPDKFDTHVTTLMTDEQIEAFANTIKEQWYV